MNLETDTAPSCKANGPPEPKTPPAVLTGVPNCDDAEVSGIRWIVRIADQRVGEAGVVHG